MRVCLARRIALQTLWILAVGGCAAQPVSEEEARALAADHFARFTKEFALNASAFEPVGRVPDGPDYRAFEWVRADNRGITRVRISVDERGWTSVSVDGSGPQLQEPAKRGLAK